ncbi:ABC transporter ATP-binding protein [Pseudoalteromonas tunicata]|uniref:ABC transporter ATP-binding protein n=1 Tax=Pseudoalteromonas tunicata TaxID=314281 RepID=UPI00273EC50E|nr:ABC transporter ATP-binding protein [Pseudoalteromonas tunicata]MDP5213368.1 ABC transporter ATP-binding protein [Pseudoalteromonas tunicata]
MLELTNASLKYQEKQVLSNINLTIHKHEIVAIVGPNGCGKSSLLNLMSGLLKPNSGTSSFKGSAITDWSGTKLARELSLLTQSPQAPDGMTVRQLTEHGRFPYQRLLQRLTTTDEDVINWAIEQVQLTALQHQTLARLSGGERQRAWLAMSLAQQTNILLLDEPTTYLDLGHQHQLLSLLKQLNQQHKKTIVMVLHDINQASQYCDRIIAIKQGKIIADGSPEQVISAQLVKQLFNIDSQIVSCQYQGQSKPLCLPNITLDNPLQTDNSNPPTLAACI